MIFSMNVCAYVCAEFVDRRNSIDGLAQRVKPRFNAEAASGSVFVFLGKTRNKAKLLVWDRHGFWLLYKRLERGRFPLPETLAQRGLSWYELMSFLEGVDLTQTKRLAPVEVQQIS